MARVVPIATVLLMMVESWLEKVDVAHRLTDKILDLERKADVHDINLLDSFHRRDIDTNRIVVPGNELL